MTTESTQPYLIRAIYEWCIDQGLTPHIAVMIGDGVTVPPGYAQDGQIVLNLGPEATSNLVIGNDAITFQARFGGKAHALSIPIANVLAIYARENGHGMAFEPQSSDPVHGQEDAAAPEDGGGDATTSEGGDDGSGTAESGTTARRSHLKIIK